MGNGQVEYRDYLRPLGRKLWTIPKLIGVAVVFTLILVSTYVAGFISDEIHAEGDPWLVRTVQNVAASPATRADIVGGLRLASQHPFGFFLISTFSLIALILLLSGAQVWWAIEHGKVQIGPLQAAPGNAGLSASPTATSSHAPVVRAAPVVGITLRHRWMDVHIPGAGYSRKLNLLFSNDGDDIHIGIARWIKDQVGLEIGKPEKIIYAFKDHLGHWGSESNDTVVAPGRWFKVWIGLDSTFPEKELNKLRDQGGLGTLEIPAIVSGARIKIRIQL